MKKLTIFGNTCQERHIEGLKKFFFRMARQDFEISVEEKFFNYLADQGVDLSGMKSVGDFDAEADCVVSIGGDGTFLHAVQWMGDDQCPILGINTGHLGFLASYSLEETDELMSAVREDRCKVESRAVLKIEGAALPAGFWPYALNEVAITKGDTASMVSIHTMVDGRLLADYLGDGLVISTPTGSTAYNLSVGGPIVHPSLECVILSPIAPHSLTMRPLVMSGDARITLTPASRSECARVSLDGRSFTIGCGESLDVVEAGFKIKVLRRPDANFPRLIRNKLGWGRPLF